MRTIKRPKRWCTCPLKRDDGFTNIANVDASFDAKQGIYVRACCGLPTKRYYEAAVEAGVLP